MTDVAGGVTRYGYDDQHRVVSMTDPREHETTNVYDAQDRVIRQTDRGGGETTFAYTATSTTVTDPRASVTRYEHPGGLTTRVVRGVGTPVESTVVMVRDASGNVTRRTDPDGQVSEVVYNAEGLPTRVTDPLGRERTMTYTATNDPQTITDPDATTTISYDAHGNPLSVSRPLVGTSTVATTTGAYDPARPGDLTSVTDANGNVWEYAYDAYGNQTSQTDPTGRRTTTAYNLIGWAMSSVSPRGNVVGADRADYTTTVERSALGDVSAVIDPLGYATQIAYDANGNPTSVTDPDGAVTATAYDALDRATRVTRPDASSVDVAYDGAGNRTRVSDGLGHATVFEFDALDRVTRVVDALQRATSYAYDASGRPVSMVDAAGRVTSFGYDDASQLIAVAYADAQTHDVVFGYDDLGRRVRMVDATGMSTWSYDSLGRLTRHRDGADRTLAYGYDTGGRLEKITYPAGLVAQTAGRAISDPSVTRAYDDGGRVIAVTDWLGTTTGYAYDADGNLIGQDYPNAVAATLSYDRAGRLTQRTDTGPAGTILELPYTRTATGRLGTHNQSATQPAVTATLDYDDRHQLESVGVAGQRVAGYAHDRGDRLTAIDSAATATVLAYDDANQLTRALDGATGDTQATFAYDESANRTLARPADGGGGLLGSPAPTAYGYDQANRLTGVTRHSSVLQDAAINATYSYDGDGLRADLMWDRSAGLPLVLGDDHALYVTGPDGLPLAQHALDGSRRYYHHDQLGSTRALTDAAGAVSDRSDYDPYGNPTTTTTATNPFGYAGQYTDHATGLIYMRARWYDPATGQFITLDPIRHASGETNLYRYGAGDPINHTDPTGLWPSFQDISNYAAGFGDTITFGGTRAIRQAFGVDNVDYCSGAYTAGEYTAYAVAGTSAGYAASVLRARGLPILRNATKGVTKGADLDAKALSRPDSIGRAGRGPDVRELDGDAADVYSRLAHGADDAAHPTYGGIRARLEDGTVIGLRKSRKHGPTLDVNPADGPAYRIHFK